MVASLASTLSNVRFPTLLCMNERSWRELQEPWERLVWARERKFASAAEAARALSLKEGTYRAYERAPDASKSTRLDYQSARTFARKFGVSWAWLLNNVGGPHDTVRMAEPEDELWSIYQRLDDNQRQQLIAIARTFLGGGAVEDPAPLAVHEPPTPELRRTGDR